MTREEALNKVRQMSLPKETMEILEALAPELAESKDERIRRKMLEHFRSKTKETWCNIPVKDIIAYLEKQKDINCLACDQHLKGYLAGRKVTEEEKQKEQKPAEWSEEDEKDMAHIIRILDDCYVYGTHDLSKTDRENLVNKLKSLRPQYHGDVTMTEAYKMGLEAGKASSWKPSEQEKGALRTAIHVLTEERSFPKAAEHLQAILDAFEDKESRKDWKPSEEQMEALHRCVDYLEESDNEDAKFMESLLEQLKKLM